MFLKCQIARYMNPKYTQMSYSSHSAMLGAGSHWLGQLDLRNKGQPRPGNKILWRRLKASRLATPGRGFNSLVCAGSLPQGLAPTGGGFNPLALAGSFWLGLASSSGGWQSLARALIYYLWLAATGLGWQSLARASIHWLWLATTGRDWRPLS